MSPRQFYWLFSLLALLLGLAACQGDSRPPVPHYWSTQGASYYDGDSYQEHEGRMMPDDHDADWLRRHGAIALAQGNDCAQCHIENDCTTCHVDSLAQAYSVHPPNYAVVHASDARQAVTDCTTCHRLDTFCAACHVETRFSPRLEDSPPSAIDFHPPGWLDAAAPNNHGIMARRDINDCASCHTERDCVSCHIGINPHPPEFLFECRSWLETNPAPCAQCHIEPDHLRIMCP